MVVDEVSGKAIDQLFHALADPTRRGREQLVRTHPEAVARARHALDQLEAAWRGRADRMADLLAHDPDPHATTS
jgi:hypothetical protein